MINSFLPAFVGLCAGIISAGALCALYIALGVLTKTAASLGLFRVPKPVIFSTAIGGILATVATIFEFSFEVSGFLIAVFGLFGGMFVGILVGCIADAVSSISIIKNLGISNKSVAVIIITFGVGKLLGSMVYWLSGVF